MVWVEQRCDISLCSIDGDVQLLLSQLFSPSNFKNYQCLSGFCLRLMPPSPDAGVWTIGTHLGVLLQKVAEPFWTWKHSLPWGSSGWPWLWLMLSVSWTTEIRGAPSAPLLPCTFPCLFCLDLTLSDCDSAVPLTVNYFASDEECTWCWHGWIHFTLICTVSSTEGKNGWEGFFTF